MSHSSFSQAYPSDCLNVYEKARHNMDSYQTHIHPKPTMPDTHPNSIHYSTSSWAPKIPWAQALHFNHPTHHFHFPATSAHDFKSRIENIREPKQPLIPVYSYMPWVPDTDIRETKLAYYIEIEVPNATDKHAMQIQCLSDRTLLIQGNVSRPEITSEPAEGDPEWVQESSEPSKPSEVSEKPLTTTPGSCPDRDTALLPWQKVDLEWCELTRHRQQVNGDGPKKAQGYGPHTDGVDEPTLLLSERKVGPWQRTFNLPLDVDLKALRAKLSGGLLSIDLPKRDMSGEPTVKIEVQ